MAIFHCFFLLFLLVILFKLFILYWFIYIHIYIYIYIYIYQCIKIATTSKAKSRFKLLSGIYARQIRENNQKVCIDCFKPRLNKNKAEYKNWGCTESYVLNFQNSSFKILSMSCFPCIKWQYCQKLNLILTA